MAHVHVGVTLGRAHAHEGRDQHVRERGRLLDGLVRACRGEVGPDPPGDSRDPPRREIAPDDADAGADVEVDPVTGRDQVEEAKRLLRVTQRILWQSKC